MKSTRKKSEPITELPSPELYGLEGYAAEYWLRIAPQLMAVGLLTSLHVDTFAEICRTYAEYRRIDDWLHEDPTRFTFVTKTGYESETPQVRMRDRALATLQKLWPKFGLHPFALAQMRKHGGVSLPRVSPLQQFAQTKYDQSPQPEAKQRTPRRPAKTCTTRRVAKVDSPR